MNTLPVSCCLLLDRSGSMAAPCGDGRSKLAALQDIASDFSYLPQYSFSFDCQLGPPLTAHGGTNLAGALATIKAAGFYYCILITDGKPDSAAAALNAAEGMTIDIIYVGPAPAPQFLADLARITGGAYGAGSLGAPRAVTQQVQLLLEHKKH